MTTVVLVPATVPALESLEKQTTDSIQNLSIISASCDSILFNDRSMVEQKDLPCCSEVSYKKPIAFLFFVAATGEERTRPKYIFTLSAV